MFSQTGLICENSCDFFVRIIANEHPFWHNEILRTLINHMYVCMHEHVYAYIYKLYGTKITLERKMKRRMKDKNNGISARMEIKDQRHKIRHTQRPPK